VGGEVVVEVLSELVYVSASIALDAQGQAHFAFYRKDGEWPAEVGYVWASDEGWATEWIPRDPMGLMRPSFAISGQGTVYVVFHVWHQGIFYATNAGGGWETTWINAVGDGAVSIAVDPDSVPHIVYHAWGSDSGVRYARPR